MRILLECQQAHSLYRYVQSLQLNNEWEDDIEGDLLFTVSLFIYPGPVNKFLLYVLLNAVLESFIYLLVIPTSW